MNTDLPCSCPMRAELDTIRNYEISIFDAIGSVPELQWNQHVPESNILMQYDALRVLENCHKQQLQFRYVFVKKDNITVGVIYFQMVRFTGVDLLNYFPAEPDGGMKKVIYKIVRGLSEPVIRSIDVKLLVSGNVFMTGENGFYFNSDIDKQTRAQLLRKAIREVTKTDAAIRAVLISDLYQPKTDFDCGFKQTGYSEITVESDMSIKLNPEWQRLDDYLAALSSKYRVRARKAFALSDEHAIEGRNLSTEEIGVYTNQLYALYKKVMDGADFKLAILDKSFFVAQKENLPNNYFINAYFKEGRVIGFISFYCIGKRMEVHYCGMEKEIAQPLHVYQRMMYEMVEFGIKNKVERIHFGRTAPEIKSTIGATPSPMYGYLKHFNPLFNALMVRTFTRRLKPKHYIIRNPFKD